MKKNLYRALLIAGSVVLSVVGTVKAQSTSVIYYWDFNQSIPIGGAGGDSLGTAYSYANPNNTYVQDTTHHSATAFAPYAPSSIVNPGNVGYMFNTSLMDDGDVSNIAGPAQPYLNELHVLGNDTLGIQGNNDFVRERNPCKNAYTYLYMPTTGFQNIVLNYALSASSTKGPNYNIFSYSTNGGSTWKNLTRAMDTFNIGGVYRPDTLQTINPTTAASLWYPIKINFSSDASVNNNQNFVVRWQYEGKNTTLTSGNDRYDNISLSGQYTGCPYIALNPTNQEVCYTGNATFSVTAAGISGYGVNWIVNTGSGWSALSDGILYSGTATSSLTVTGANLSMNGYQYACVASVGGGECSNDTSLAATLLVDPQLGVTIPTVTDVNCTTLGTATSSVTGGASPYTYVWNGASTATNASYHQAEATGLQAGTYTVTVKDLAGCSASASIAITTAPVPKSTLKKVNIECSGTGSLTVNGVNGIQPYTYSWSGAASTQTTPSVSGLPAGTYISTLTDNNGCSVTASATITSVAPVSTGIIGGGATKVLHYWDFNNTAASPDSLGTPYSYANSSAADSAVNTAQLFAPYSISPGVARIVLSRPSVKQTTPLLATERDSDIDNGAGGAAVNDLHILGNDSAGGNLYIRARNPDENAYVYIYAPTTGYNNIQFNYALSASSTSGCWYNVFSYSTNGGASWNTLTSAMDTFNTGGRYHSDTLQVINPITASSNWYPVNINFSSDPNVNNNPNFIIRWTFVGAQSNGTSGNDRYDNFSIVGQLPQESCYGGNGFSVTAAPQGGTGPFSYSWTPNLGTTASLNNVTAGTYSLTVTDANGCSSSVASTVVSQPTPVVESITGSTNASCNNANNGTATASATGGNSSYSYSWTGGQTTATATGLTAGTYTLTVTDQYGCTATNSVSTTISAPAAITTTASATNVTCNGNNNGTATATPNGGTAPYTFLWSIGDSVVSVSNPATGLTAGTYTVTVTDANNCSPATASVIITQPTLLTTTARTVTNVTGAPNATNGSVSATANGGTSPYTYSWTSGSAAPTSTGLGAGTYTVTVMDANGCSATAQAVVTAPAALAIVKTTATSSCTGSASVTLSGGVSPYTYTWEPGGLKTASITGLEPNTYTVTVQDKTGASVSATATITAPSSVSITKTTATASCANSNTGTATVTATAGTAPYMYSWTGGATTATASDLGAGTYTVIVTDKCGSTASATAVITNPAALSITRTTATTSCGEYNSGIVSVSTTGGTSPYMYSWTGGATTATVSNLGAGTYTVIVTDKCGSSASATAIVSNPAAIAIKVSATLSCTQNSTGTASVISTTGGTSPYTYAWTGGGNTAKVSNISAGTYSVTVSDKCGSSVTASTVVSNPAALVVTKTTNGLSCSQNPTGTASVSITGGETPYVYSWTNSEATTASATGLSAGTYSITISDKCGSSTAATAIVTNPAAMAIKVSATLSCTQKPTGTVSVISTTGGESPYTYAWTGGGNTAKVSDISAGTYSVTVSDKCGSSTSASTVVSNPAALSVKNTVTNVSGCFGNENGKITAAGLGGIAPYTYTWTKEGSTATISNLFAGTYTVTVEDMCTSTYSITAAVSQPTELHASAVAAGCTGSEIGKATVTATGGTAPYTYNWSNGGTKTIETGLTAGTYSIAVMDRYECSATTSVVVTCGVPPAIEQHGSYQQDGSQVQNISVYPNPNTGMFTIAGLQKGMLIEMYDYTGRIVSNITASDETIQLNIANEANGVYLIRIMDINGNLVSQNKVVKTQ